MENQEIIILHNMDELINSQVGVLQINNKDQLYTAISLLEKKYADLLVTEETLKTCKEDCNFLKRISKNLDTKRKDIQKPHKEILDSFKKDIDDIISKITVLSSNIETQVQIFDDQESMIKTEEINKIIQSIVNNYDIKDLTNLITFDSKWLNKTKTLNQISDEIVSIAIKIQGEKKLREALILTRKSLIKELNQEYNYNFNEDLFSVDKYTDDEIRLSYEKQRLSDLEKSKKLIELEKKNQEQKQLSSELKHQVEITKKIESTHNTLPNKPNDSIWEFNLSVLVDSSKISDKEKTAIKDIINFIIRKNFGEIHIVRGDINDEPTAN